MFKWFQHRHQTYMRDGYRWHELHLTQRRYLTWQMPFTRPYSIAQTQRQIDSDVALAVEDVGGALVGKAEFTRRFLNEEKYDGG